jgi:poly(3-hydroxybutyrate) depolymerase
MIDLRRKSFRSSFAAWLMATTAAACGSSPGEETSGPDGANEVGGGGNGSGGANGGASGETGGNGGSARDGATNSRDGAANNGDAAANGGDAGAMTNEAGDVLAQARDAGNGRDGTADAASTGDAAVDRPSSGCGRTATGTSSYVRASINVAGTDREYFLWVPRTYMPNQAYPVIFRWHGSTGNGLSGGLEIEASSRESALIASPSGIGGNWSLSANGVDVQLFDTLLADLESRFCIDTGRVFSYGFSAGGGMTNLLGCVRGNVVRAIAPVEGVLPTSTGCRGPVAGWITHSPDDTVVDISMGRAARDLLLSLDGCGATTMPVSPTPCVRYQGCQTGYPVDFCQTSGQHDPQGSFTGPGAWSFFNSLR